jgi:hypothetical protein
MAGNVNADLGHDLDGKRMDVTGRMGTGALDIDEIARRRPQKAFGDVAAAGVAGTKNENSGFHKKGQTLPKHSTFQRPIPKDTSE